MKSKVHIIIKTVICSLIPAFFNYVGTSEFLVLAKEQQYIGNKVDIQALKNISLLLSIILTFILLTLNLAIAEFKSRKYEKQVIELIKYTKEIMVATLSKNIGKKYCDINIRIFVPKRTLLKKIMNMFLKEKSLYFEIKNKDGLADVGKTNKLTFRVLPKDKREGLVGDCFHEQKIIYDDNLAVTNETDYNLNRYQKSKTNDLRFIIVCPTFNQKGEISSIVAFDSKSNIKVTNKNEKILSDLVLNYTQQLHEYIPEYFK